MNIFILLGHRFRGLLHEIAKYTSYIASYTASLNFKVALKIIPFCFSVRVLFSLGPYNVRIIELVSQML